MTAALSDVRRELLTALMRIQLRVRHPSSGVEQQRRKESNDAACLNCFYGMIAGTEENL